MGRIFEDFLSQIILFDSKEMKDSSNQIPIVFQAFRCIEIVSRFCQCETNKRKTSIELVESRHISLAPMYSPESDEEKLLRELGVHSSPSE